MFPLDRKPWSHGGREYINLRLQETQQRDALFQHELAHDVATGPHVEAAYIPYKDVLN